MVHDMPWKAHRQVFIFAPQAVRGSFGWGSEGQASCGGENCKSLWGSPMAANHLAVPVGVLNGACHTLDSPKRLIVNLSFSHYKPSMALSGGG